MACTMHYKCDKCDIMIQGYPVCQLSIFEPVSAKSRKLDLCAECYKLFLKNWAGK